MKGKEKKKKVSTSPIRANWKFSSLSARRGSRNLTAVLWP